MELVDYIRILRKRWWIILATVALTAGSAVAFSALRYPEYTSTVEIVIEPARPDWGLAQAAKMVLRTYMTVANSDKWAQKVIDRLGLLMTPKQLRSKAHFAAEDDRMVIRLEVESYDGEMANDIARTWADLLVQWRGEKNAEQRKEDQVYAELRDQPSYYQSWPPGKKVMLAAGGMFGLAIAGVIIFFLEWLEAGVIRTPRDLDELNLSVVGAIPPAE